MGVRQDPPGVASEAQVRIVPHGRQFTCGRERDVLAAALAAGLNLPHSCKAGHCGSCRARLLSGRIRYPDGRRPLGLAESEEREGWVLARNYNDEIGASVADAFGTDDPRAVEAYCRANKIDFQWQPDGGLRTWQRRRAVTIHPITGQRCWFNQIAFLNEWTMEPEVREFLVDCYGPQGLPFTTLFGNGEPIGQQIVDLIADVYVRHTHREPWQPGDLLLVDNIRTAHSREPFDGQREILVGMADPMRVSA